MITRDEFKRIYHEAGAPYRGGKPPLGKLIAALTDAGMEWGEEPAPELLPCPACDGPAAIVGEWNALPRRSTASEQDEAKAVLGRAMILGRFRRWWRDACERKASAALGVMERALANLAVDGPDDEQELIYRVGAMSFELWCALSADRELRARLAEQIGRVDS